MKNIQVIDDADNCVYDVFQATDEEFEILFPNSTDISFFDDVWDRSDQETLKPIMDRIWSRPIKKRDANGIYGILFYGMDYKKQYYPTLKDDEAVNPDGTLLRRS